MISLFHQKEMKLVEDANFMKENEKFGLIHNHLENQTRWTSLANTIFGLMKAIDPKRLENYSDFPQYMRKDGEGNTH